jgi:hypothetical protein
MRRGQERAEYSAFRRDPARARPDAILLPQFFGTFPLASPGEAPFEGFNAKHGPQGALSPERDLQMSASSTQERERPWIVDFFSMLLLAFCIGIATSVVLGAAVVLMASEARGAEGAQLIETVPLAPSDEEQDTVLIRSEALPSCRAGFPGASPRSGGRTCRAGRDEDRGGERCAPDRGEIPLPGCPAVRASSPRTMS